MGKDRGFDLGHGEERQYAPNPTYDAILSALILTSPTLSQALSLQLEAFMSEQEQENQDPGRLLVRFIQVKAREINTDEPFNAEFCRQMTRKHSSYSEQFYAMKIEGMPQSELHIIDATAATGGNSYLVALTHIEEGGYVLDKTIMMHQVNNRWAVDEYTVEEGIGFNEVLYYFDDAVGRCNNITRTEVRINHPTGHTGGGSPVSLHPAPLRIDFKRPQPSITKQAA